MLFLFGATQQHRQCGWLVHSKWGIMYRRRPNTGMEGRGQYWPMRFIPSVKALGYRVLDDIMEVLSGNWRIRTTTEAGNEWVTDRSISRRQEMKLSIIGNNELLSGNFVIPSLGVSPCKFEATTRTVGVPVLSVALFNPMRFTKQINWINSMSRKMDALDKK